VADHGRLDVVIHNVGHMVFGPAEAFTPEQLAELYDINVLSTQRVNRAALPHLRRQKQGLIIWVSSGMSQRQRYCGCGGSDRNISTGSA
jgi:NAD(P)-dependent dehydrogenase (short-subunit alcohol dehydrogenase family)